VLHRLLRLLHAATSEEPPRALRQIAPDKHDHDGEHQAGQ